MGDASRREGLSGKVQTVLGPVDAYEIGVTLPHEHMFTQMSHVAKEPAEAERKAAFHAPVTIEVLGSIRYGSAIVLDNCRLDDVDTAIAEVSLFREAGGGTIVDVTSIGIGRNPEGLVRIARASGVNIVMGSSYYVEENYPSERGVRDKTEDEIADEILGDIFEGVDGTDVRAGVIGEVGCSWPLTATERKVLRASGLAQRRSGAALTIHPGRNSAAPLEIVEVLRDAGADLGRTILGHLDRTIDDPRSLEKLAAAGCIWSSIYSVTRVPMLSFLCRSTCPTTTNACAVSNGSSPKATGRASSFPTTLRSNNSGSATAGTGTPTSWPTWCP